MKGKIVLNEHRLWVALRQIFYLVIDIEDNVTAKHGLTNQQFTVLWIMEIMNKVIKEPIKITDIAPLIYRTVYSVSTIIDRMEKKGLVTKERNLPDRRSVRVSITPKGHEKFIKVLKPYREMLKRVLVSYSEKDLLMFMALLKSLETNIINEPDMKGVEINPSIRNGEEIVDFLNQDI